jgi:hypothetical protein
VGPDPIEAPDLEGSVWGRALADVVQEHQFLAHGGSGNGSAVDDLELQIRRGVQQSSARMFNPRDKSGAAQNAAKS